MGTRKLIFAAAAALVVIGLGSAWLFSKLPGPSPVVREVLGHVPGGSNGTALQAPSGPGPATDSRVGDDGFEEDPSKRSVSDQDARRPRSVDLIVLDRAGESLLGRGSPLPREIRQWVRPRVGSGLAPAAGSRVPEGAEELSGRMQRIKRTEGWFNAFEPAGERAWAALCYGEFVVVAQPVTPGTDSLTLVAGVDEIQAMQCTVTGRLPGDIYAGSLAKVLPFPGLERRGLRGPIFGTGTGESFRVEGIPPGRSRLSVRMEALAVPDVDFRSGSDVTALEEWQGRLGSLASLEVPSFDQELDLVPGQVMDIGAAGEHAPARALRLDLADETGATVAAKEVDVAYLRPPGNTHRRSPWRWTYSSQVCVYPLPSAPCELQVTLGGAGALFEVTPGPARTADAITRVSVTLEPLALVVLPPKRGARLETERGHVLHMDPRWVGSKLRGRGIDEHSMAVPKGRYRLVLDGEPERTIQVEAGGFHDLSGEGAWR